MSEPTNIVILFADVCGSTGLYEALGDDKASAAIGTCLKTIEACGQAHAGELIKTIGDEIMMVFPSPAQAAEAAHAMHDAAAALQPSPGRPMSLHIGFHFGSAVRNGLDVHGDSVNLAARLVSLAKPGQTLTSASTLDHLPERWLNQTRPVDKTQVRGRTGQVTMFELIWQPEEATRMVELTKSAQGDNNAPRLMLKHRGHQVTLGPEHPIVTLGRADSCDLVIRHDLVSRLHARLEYRKERFSLTDQSTNGTYVRPEQGKTLFLRRDGHSISGSGLISLGTAVDPETEDVIRFTQLS